MLTTSAWVNVHRHSIFFPNSDCFECVFEDFRNNLSWRKSALHYFRLKRFEGRNLQISVHQLSNVSDNTCFHLLKVILLKRNDWLKFSFLSSWFNFLVPFLNSSTSSPTSAQFSSMKLFKFDLMYPNSVLWTKSIEAILYFCLEWRIFIEEEKKPTYRFHFVCN